MKTKLAFLTLTFSFILNALAGSATWRAHPTSADWDSAANWNPGTVPNGPNDIATFAASVVKDIMMPTDSFEVDSIVFAPGASPFTFTVQPDAGLFTFSGAGITNNSGVTQNFVTYRNNVVGFQFTNQATAGDQVVFTPAEGPSYITFNDEATAGSATFRLPGTVTFEDGGSLVLFYDNSSAAEGVFLNDGGADYDGEGGATIFHNNSTAANGTFTNGAATDTYALSGAATLFYENSTAGKAVITNDGSSVLNNYAGGFTHFFDHASAANATITCNGGEGPQNGGVSFYDSSSAGNATLIAKGGSQGGAGGLIEFWNEAIGDMARVKLSGNGTLDISNDTKPGGVSIGSLEGNGIVLLGTDTLSIGANNLSTLWSGVIQGGDTHSLGRGAVNKVGSGTLTLTGANTYSGGTFVSGGGFLRVENRHGSATGSGPVTIFSGSTVGGSGLIGGSVLLNSGGMIAPGTGATTLTVKKLLAFGDASHYVWRVRTTVAKSDKVVADAVAIGSGALFTGLALGNATLSPGTTFTAIDNTSSDPISGTFALLPDGGTITIGKNTFQANYEGGDGNDLTLTVVQ